MNFCDLIESFREELPRFNAHDYPLSFTRFEESASPLFDALAHPVEEARSLEEECERRSAALPRKAQKEALQQVKMVLTLYLVPAALRRGRNAAAFAQELNRVWNARFPRNSFRLGSYEDIMRGFDATFLGIPLKNYSRR